MKLVKSFKCPECTSPLELSEKVIKPTNCPVCDSESMKLRSSFTLNDSVRYKHYRCTCSGCAGSSSFYEELQIGAEFTLTPPEDKQSSFYLCTNKQCKSKYFLTIEERLIRRKRENSQPHRAA